MEPLRNYYRYVKCYFPKTRREQDCDIVKFFLCKITFPSIQLKNYLYQVVDNITHLLLHRPSSTVPSLEAGDLTRNAISKLAQLFKRVEKILAVKISDHTLSPRVKKVDLVLPPRVLAKSSNIYNNTTSPEVYPIEYDEDDIDIYNQYSNSKPNNSVIPMSVLQQCSNLPKTLQFQNQIPHYYHLRSKKSYLIPDDAVVQHIFNPVYTVNYIYQPDGKKETIDSLIQGDKAHI